MNQCCRGLSIVLCAMGMIATFQALAQQPAKIWRVGYLATSDPATTPMLEEFRAGLRERGYTEGKNLVIEYRWARGRPEGHAEMAAELVALKVDAIFAWATPAVAAARQATSTIPIVMVGVADPVGSGFIASLARPGGNVTGVTNVAGDLTVKLLELLLQVVPGNKRVAVLRIPSNAGSVRQMENAQVSARTLGLELQEYAVRGPEDFESAYAKMAGARVAGVVILGDPVLTANSQRLAELAIKHRLASIHNNQVYPGAGGLMSYGAGFESWRLAATYVDRILKGAKPSDLPVEQPSRIEFVINLKTSKALGIAVPQSVLARADKVIQ